MYAPRRHARSEFVAVRNVNLHLRVWGEPRADEAPLVLVHGWMDVGASFQFMVDALRHDRWVVAPDWRGFGRSTSSGADCYWFPDYLADLDFLLDRLAPDGRTVDLVGHSMGGNIAMLYAGVRPGRVRRLVNLEGFGLPATQPDEAAGRYTRFMDELKALHRGDMVLKAYDSADAVARRLMKTNPRLARDTAGQGRAAWLARHWAEPRREADGTERWHVLGEPGHKLANASLYRVDEVRTIYQRITAPVLAVEAGDNSLARFWEGRYTLAEYHERLTAIANVRVAVVTDAGHMLHHDQPETLARLIEDFLAEP